MADDRRDGGSQESGSKLGDAKAAWGRSYEGLTQGEIDRRVLGFTALIRGIAASGGVSAREFGREMQLDEKQASDSFTQFRDLGMEVDESGRIVGAALTTRPTAHSVVVTGRRLFAWCALDTLFIPGLLGETAEVESTCPSSGAPIRLTVTPDGVSAASPPDLALTVVVPAVGTPEATIGPTGTT